MFTHADYFIEVKNIQIYTVQSGARLPFPHFDTTHKKIHAVIPFSFLDFIFYFISASSDDLQLPLLLLLPPIRSVKLLSLSANYPSTYFISNKSHNCNAIAFALLFYDPFIIACTFPLFIFPFEIIFRRSCNVCPSEKFWIPNVIRTYIRSFQRFWVEFIGD